MKRVLIKILILTAVFVGSVFAFSFYFNGSETTEAKAWEGTDLPVMTMRYDGKDINCMFGYSEEMAEATLRDFITLLPYDRNLTVTLNPYEAEVESVGYRVSSLMDGSVTENGKIKTFTDDGALKVAEVHLENPITMGQEYMLRFDVTLKDGRIYHYYTRILQRNGQNLNWYLDYTDAFYRNCLAKNITEEMYQQLEPETSEANSSLHYVNIHSDEEQLTWGNLEPSLVKQAVPRVIELNEMTVSIGLDYIISTQNEFGRKEYYVVNEYYRMRKAQENVVLLDFERRTNQCFDSQLEDVPNETGINLGITGKDVQYYTNEDADIAVFVQSGELWEYNREAGKACRIFTFRSDDHTDPRTENQEYGLGISSVSPDGNVDFIVYGHMNSGIHEGGNGILVCRYYADTNKNEELLYIPSDQGHEMLGRSLSKLAYLNSNNQFFACYGDSISTIQLSDLTSFLIKEALDWDTFAVSDSQTLVAWTNENNGRKESVSELDLNTGDTLQIEAPEGEQIISLGFMGEDLVYGLLRDSDSYTDATGNTIYLMYRVCLINSSGEPIKEFYEKDLFVSSVEKDGSMLNLTCYTQNDGQPVRAKDNQIVYYETEKEETVEVRLTVSERKGTEVSLVFTQSGRTNSILTQHARSSNNENTPSATLEPGLLTSERYLVYAKGGLYDIFMKLNISVDIADEQVGVVLNTEQQYVWERGNYKESVTLDIEQIPARLYAAPLDEDVVAAAVGPDYKVWNLSGCSLSSIKYQISSGYPVCAKWSEDKNVLIIGYDTYENIWIYDVISGEPKAIAFEEAQEAFAQFGNIFISYHI